MTHYDTVRAGRFAKKATNEAAERLRSIEGVYENLQDDVEDALEVAGLEGYSKGYHEGSRATVERIRERLNEIDVRYDDFNVVLDEEAAR